MTTNELILQALARVDVRLAFDPAKHLYTLDGKPIPALQRQPATRTLPRSMPAMLAPSLFVVIH